MFFFSQYYCMPYKPMHVPKGLLEQVVNLINYFPNVDI